MFPIEFCLVKYVFNYLFKYLFVISVKLCTVCGIWNEWVFDNSLHFIGVAAAENCDVHFLFLDNYGIDSLLVCFEAEDELTEAKSIYEAINSELHCELPNLHSRCVRVNYLIPDCIAISACLTRAKSSVCTDHGNS